VCRQRRISMKARNRGETISLNNNNWGLGSGGRKVLVVQVLNRVTKKKVGDATSSYFRLSHAVRGTAGIGGKEALQIWGREREFFFGAERGCQLVNFPICQRKVRDQGGRGRGES